MGEAPARPDVLERKCGGKRVLFFAKEHWDFDVVIATTPLKHLATALSLKVKSR